MKYSSLKGVHRLVALMVERDLPAHIATRVKAAIWADFHYYGGRALGYDLSSLKWIIRYYRDSATTFDAVLAFLAFGGYGGTKLYREFLRDSLRYCRGKLGYMESPLQNSYRRVIYA